MKDGLRELLACPTCKGPLQDAQASLLCIPCGSTYPIDDGVPVFLPGSPKATEQLHCRGGYGPWYYFYTIASLPRSSHILDIGSGDMALNHPNIFRMDVFRGPNVDVVADVCAMPFREGAFDFSLSIAVLEHLADPFAAADEMLRVTRPGGYVYADTNFVFPYHGYPHHYFNFSIDGIEQVFRKWEKLHVTVPPYLMPSQALVNILNGYLMWFCPRNSVERDCYEAIKTLHEFPLLEFDSAIDQDKAHVFAAGVCFYGRRPDDGAGGPIPRQVLEAWKARPDLHRSIPDPTDLSQAWNVMTWAAQRGRLEHETLRSVFENIELIGTDSLGTPAPADRPGQPGEGPLRSKTRALLRAAKSLAKELIRTTGLAADRKRDHR